MRAFFSLGLPFLLQEECAPIVLGTDKIRARSGDRWQIVCQQLQWLTVWNCSPCSTSRHKTCMTLNFIKPSSKTREFTLRLGKIENLWHVGQKTPMLILVPRNSVLYGECCGAFFSIKTSFFFQLKLQNIYKVHVINTHFRWNKFLSLTFQAQRSHF